MDNYLQFSVNIAMESILLLLVVIMLVTCFCQKKIFVTTIPFLCLSALMILMFINQIVTWVILLNDVPVVYGIMPMRIVYILDYVLYYGVTVAFYYYVEALVIDGYKRIGITFYPKRIVHIMVVAWGVVTSLGYSVMVFVPSIYRIEDGVAVYSIPAYIAMHIMIIFALACAMVLIVRNRKYVGSHDSILCFTFIILVVTFSIVDELCGLCISYIILSFFIFILYVRIDLHKELMIERQEKEITMWKTQIMLSQMQPHFLYNVLTTISGMCEIDNAIQARDVVNRFADYIRTNLDSMGKNKMIPFEKELEHVKTYLWLEKIRFEDDLNIRYEIGPTDFVIPSLIVQPMVENAVKHGIRPKENPGTVTIKTLETEDNYVIVVEDDGVGFDINEQINDSRSHVGIENVTKRLEVICNGSCEIQSEKGKGTIVLINIPKGDQL